jgi:hypothetical protein
MEVADRVTAVNGRSNDTIMTPLRVKQAISASSSSPSSGNYDDLTNKPSINSVTLTGNRIIVEDKNYVHVQDTASASWVITHNLGKYPSVTIVDSAGDEVEASVEHNSINSLTITFAAENSGKAYCN